MKFKRVVAYGCSFTAAEETGDADFLGVDEEELDAIKLENLIRNENEKFQKLVSEWKIRNNKTYFPKEESEGASHAHSWVAHFAKEYNLPLANRAEPGSAFQNILFKIQRDIHNGKIRDDDLVVVGTTTANRLYKLYPHPDPDRGWMKLTKVMGAIGNWSSFPEHTMANGDTFSKRDWEDSSKWLVNFELNNYNIHFVYLQTFLTLLYLGETFLKNRLIIVPVLGPYQFAAWPAHKREKWGFTAEDDNMFNVNLKREYYDDMLASIDPNARDTNDVEYLENRIDFDQYLDNKFGCPERSLIPYLWGKVHIEFIDICTTMVDKNTEAILQVPGLSDFKKFLVINEFKKKTSHGWGHPTKLVHKLYYEKCLKNHLRERVECLIK